MTVPAATAVEAGDPFGFEPTTAPVDGLRDRPCPTLAAPSPGQPCYAFATAIDVASEAPAEAAVPIDIVHTGSNVEQGCRHLMYYEGVSVVMEGPHEGVGEATGFAATEEGG
ncbi:MAG: hypothetical protein V5A24_03870 [Haloarculaceae archaeon]